MHRFPCYVDHENTFGVPSTVYKVHINISLCNFVDANCKDCVTVTEYAKKLNEGAGTFYFRFVKK